MSQRRYYVLTSHGEVGPHNRTELRELLRTGRIAPDDRLRTALGTAAGTVEGILAERADAGSDVLEVIETGEAAPTPRTGRGSQRRASARRAVVDADEIAEPRRVPVVPIALGVALAALLLGWWWLAQGDRRREAEQRTVAAELAAVSITGEDGSWLLGRDAGFTIRLAAESNVPQTIALDVTGSAVPGVDFAVLPGTIVIPAGAREAQLACHPLAATVGRRPAVQVTVGVLPGAGYRAAAPSSATVTLANDEPRAGGPPLTWVGDLPFVEEWNGAHAPMRDRSQDNNRLSIDQMPYDKGLGMHAGQHGRDPESHATFALDGRYREFLATVGIDDEAKAESSAIFQVWLDDRLAFASGILGADSPGLEVRVDVSGAKVLRLVITDAGDSQAWDHCDWGYARLIGK